MVQEIHELLHPKGFSAALWPYRSSAMVFSHCNTKSKMSRAIYALIMTSASFIYSYFVGYDMYMSLTQAKKSEGHVIMSYFGLWCHLSETPLQVLTWFFIGHSCFVKCVASLTLVDRDLSQICTRKMNLKMTVVRQLVCIFLAVLLSLTLITGHIFLKSDSMSWWHVFVFSASHYSWTSNIVLMSFFGNFVRFIGDRYALINHTLQGINSMVKIGSFLNLPKVTSDRATLMQQLRVAHRKLFFVSRILTEAFEIQAFSCLLSSLCFTVYKLYEEYQIGSSPSGKWTVPGIFLAIVTLVYNFGIVIYVAYCCDQTVCEANGTAKILNSLTTASNEDLRLEVSSFSYQLMHYQLNFSPLGFFQLDLGLVQSMIASIATYLVILVQMGSVRPDVVENSTASYN